MTLLKLAITRGNQVRRQDRGLGRGGRGKEDAKNLFVDDEAAAEFRHGGRFGLEQDVDVVAGAVLAVGDAGEGLLVHFLNGFDLAARGGDFGGDLVNDLLERFLAGGAA
jgi:hypothetical protein